jgi:hypothetical protein
MKKSLEDYKDKWDYITKSETEVSDGKVSNSK